MKKDSATLVVGGHLKSKKEIKMYQHEKNMKNLKVLFSLLPSHPRHEI